MSYVNKRRAALLRNVTDARGFLPSLSVWTMSYVNKRRAALLRNVTDARGFLPSLSVWTTWRLRFVNYEIAIVHTFAKLFVLTRSPEMDSVPMFVLAITILFHLIAKFVIVHAIAKVQLIAVVLWPLHCVQANVKLCNVFLRNSRCCLYLYWLLEMIKESVGIIAFASSQCVLTLTSPVWITHVTCNMPRVSSAELFLFLEKNDKYSGIFLAAIKFSAGDKCSGIPVSQQHCNK